MKCAECRQGLTYPSWTVTLTGIDGGASTVNLHRSCVATLIGRVHRTLIEDLTIRAGWVQPPLGLTVLAD